MALPDSFTLPSGKVLNDKTYRKHRHHALGAGCTREVYGLTDDAVLKVCTPGHTWANEQEIERWASLEPEHVGFYAAIHAASPSGLWLIMERVVETLDDWSARRGIPWTDDYECWRLRTRVRTKSARSLYDFIEGTAGLLDIHGGNIGRTRRGQWKIIDYGE